MSQNNHLIPVFTGDIAGTSVQLVDARVLHTFLEVGKDFSTWIKDRVEQFDFQKCEDFVTLTKIGEGKSSGFQPIEYHLTFDMAKEISMVERNAKGKEARRYFIACEKQLLESVVTAPKLPLYAQRHNLEQDARDYDGFLPIERQCNIRHGLVYSVNGQIGKNDVFWVTGQEWIDCALADPYNTINSLEKRTVKRVSKAAAKRSEELCIKDADTSHWSNHQPHVIKAKESESASLVADLREKLVIAEAEVNKWRDKFIESQSKCIALAERFIASLGV